MKKRILFVSNYYAPYTSGVTEVERLVAEKLASDGYEVKVITSKHDKALPTVESINGVPVERCRVLLKISKGIISPSFIIRTIRQAKYYDIVNLQLPMLESGLLSLFIKKKKLMPMYHCDINLPKGLLNSMITKIMDCSHKICLKRCSKVWVTSADYAIHSRVAYKYSNKFVEVGGPIKKISASAHISEQNYKIGFCGRIVEEKGIDILIKAFEILQARNVDAELLIGGDYKNVAGGSVYPALIEYINEHQIKNIKFLGKVPEEKLGEFYSSLDVFVLPSINSLEAFGLVQVEAMMCGVPVVSTDLYGVRTIVQKTGMGLVSQKGNVENLADCIFEVLTNRKKYIKDKSIIETIFSTEAFVKNIGCYINDEEEKKVV